jgi:hypothetical protein
LRPRQKGKAKCLETYGERPSDISIPKGERVSKDEDAEPSLSQLIAARDNVRREIDILRDSSPAYGSNRDMQVGGLIGELEATLRELERLISEWKSN